jgi:hypothetical protein
MSSLADQVQGIVKEKNAASNFYDDYKKFEQGYQEMVDKGWASRRESQLPTIAEKMRMLNYRI